MGVTSKVGPGAAGARYTHGHHESVLRSHTWRTAANSAAYLLPELDAGMDLLDVGCGPGTITADLARYVAPGRAVGIDTAEDVLVRAAEFAGARDVDNVLFETGDVYSLGYGDGSFDVVHAHQVLQHLGDPVGALRQMRRVLRPGGVLAIRDADYGAMRWYPEIPALDDWQRLYRAVARRNGGEPDAGRRVLAWVRAAGFDDVTPSASTWCFAEPELREWWSGLWADRLTQSAFGAHAKETGLADDAELARLADAFREWGADPDGWFAVVHGEVLAHR